MVTISTRTSGQRLAQRRGRLDAVEAGHLDVEQGHVGAVLAARPATTSSPAADLGDHLEVGLEVEQRRQGAAHERLVVGEQQPDDRHRATTDSAKPARLERAG